MKALKVALRAQLLILALGVSSVAAQDCVPPGQAPLIAPQKDGWILGSIGGSIAGPDCTFDVPVTKDWTVRLKPSGDVAVVIQSAGYARIDPLQPFTARQDGYVRILIRRTTERGAEVKYKLLFDLRKPGL